MSFLSSNLWLFMVIGNKCKELNDKGFEDQVNTTFPVFSIYPPILPSQTGEEAFQPKEDFPSVRQLGEQAISIRNCLLLEWVQNLPLPDRTGSPQQQRVALLAEPFGLPVEVVPLTGRKLNLPESQK